MMIMSDSFLDSFQGLGRQAARARRSHRQGADGLRAAHDLHGTCRCSRARDGFTMGVEISDFSGFMW